MIDKCCKVIVIFIWIGVVIFGILRFILDDFIKFEKLWIFCFVVIVVILLLVMFFSYGKIFLVV